MTSYPALQYALVRILLGLYLATYFGLLIPHAATIFGRDGLFHALDATPFPNPLMADSPMWPPLFMAFLAVLGLGYAAGLQRKAVALLLWYGWACLINRLPFITIPSEGYIGWLLLASLLIPFGEGLALDRRDPRWQLPTGIFVGAWVVQALSYSVSGVGKLWSPSWIDGSALSLVLEGALVRPTGLADLLASLPPRILQAGTWIFLGLEVLVAPLCLTSWGRKLAWSAMVVVHLVMLVLVDITSVSLGMLVFHAFTFDARWLRWRAASREATREPEPGGVLAREGGAGKT